MAATILSSGLVPGWAGSGVGWFRGGLVPGWAGSGVGWFRGGLVPGWAGSGVAARRAADHRPAGPGGLVPGGLVPGWPLAGPPITVRSVRACRDRQVGQVCQVGQVWQEGQKNVDRPPKRSFRMVSPQRAQGLPALA